MKTLICLWFGYFCIETIPPKGPLDGRDGASGIEQGENGEDGKDAPND